MAERIQIEVTMNGIYSYSRPAFGYGMETAYIYNMVAEDGTVYVWKTTTFMGYEVEDPNGWILREKNGHETAYRFDAVNKGDKLVITGTIKGQGEYKGQPQTELTRVKVKDRTFKAETQQERLARIEAEKKAKAEEQRNSLQGEDFIWEMPYRQYKEHYSDCETVNGSFRRLHGVAVISVIVREGRLKASGVRGEHYSGYRLVNEDGEYIVYRAVKEENAIKRAEKEFPEYTWTCDKIYAYR